MYKQYEFTLLNIRFAFINTATRHEKMSGIFEKTLESIGSLLSPLGTNVGLKNMLERCISARTKKVRTGDNDRNIYIKMYSL